jgi:hypothetical protein
VSITSDQKRAGLAVVRSVLESAWTFLVGFIKRIWLGLAGVVQPAIQTYNDHLAPRLGWPYLVPIREDIQPAFYLLSALGLLGAAIWTYHDLRIAQRGSESLPDLGDEARRRWTRLHHYLRDSGAKRHDDTERYRIFVLPHDDFRRRLRAAGVRDADLEELLSGSFRGRWSITDLQRLQSVMENIAIRLGAEREQGPSEWVERWTGKTPIGQVAPRPDSVFADAPIVRWMDPSAELYADGTIALDVWCENSGASGSVAVVMRHDAEWQRSDGSPSPEEMRFQQFTIPSYIHSIHSDPNARFLVRIRSLYPSSISELGEKKIKWLVYYYDNDMNLGYLTEASVVADFQGRGKPATIVGQPALDATSPRVRHERFLEWRKNHDEPTT